MSKRTIATILLILGIFVAGIPCGIITLVILKNEEAPVYKTLAIIEIVAVAISLFY
jgi:hypothetical protein